MKPLVPPHIAALTPYPPGKPIDEVRRELGIEGEIVKLASNENPLGPSPKAVQAIIDATADLHIYPDGGGFYLKRKLAERLGVEPSQLILGNGSNEIIELLIRAFVGPDETAVLSETSFVVYQLVLRAAGRGFTAVPLSGYAYDLDAMAAAATDSTKITFVATPNNPTGLHVSGSELARFAGKLADDVVLVVDEAYVEYVTADDAGDVLGLIRERPRTIALRTFSKAYGIAGVRCGYGVTSTEIVSLLDRVRQPFNCNTLAQAAAVAALDDQDHLARSRDNNTNEMKRLGDGLSKLGFSPVPSQANFLLVDMGRPGKPIFEALLRQGVIVRAMDGYGLPNCLRITVGRPQDNDRVLSALEST